jgi:hypothetical protein
MPELALLDMPSAPAAPTASATATAPRPAGGPDADDAAADDAVTTQLLQACLPIAAPPDPEALARALAAHRPPLP